MDQATLRKEIVEYCASNADEEIVKKYARYFKNGTEGYQAYGVTTGLIRAKVKELSGDPQVTLSLLMDTAPSLLENGMQEETIILFLLVENKMKQLKAEDFPKITAWFRFGVVNWSQNDLLCNKILPWFFLRRILPLSAIAEWQTSPYRFQRRSLAVLMIKLLKSTDEYAPFFDLITPIMLDQERVVHQGIGWFLREAWKRKPAQTEQFLLLWKESAARLIFQYATERMSSQERLQFKKNRK